MGLKEFFRKKNWEQIWSTQTNFHSRSGTINGVIILEMKKPSGKLRCYIMLDFLKAQSINLNHLLIMHPEAQVVIDKHKSNLHENKKD